MNDKIRQTSIRKDEHLEIFRTENCVYPPASNWLEDVRLVHNALSDVDFDKIDTSTYFLNHKFDVPFFITALTGGTEKAREINIALAEVAQKFGMGFGVGSQRAMLEYPELTSTYDVKKYAPDVFLAGNIGAAQLKEWSPREISQMLEDIKADALCIHLNPAQEIMQQEGNHDFERILDKISLLVPEMTVPVMVKEVGCGISREVAQQLIEKNIQYFDCAGLGGTNWQVIELLRAGKTAEKNKNAFLNWGIPTAASCMELNSTQAEFIGSGGITNGLEAAKVIALGASMAGFAGVVLKAWFKGEKEVEKTIDLMLEGLKCAMFLTGSKTINDLKRSGRIISGELKTWCETRGIVV